MVSYMCSMNSFERVAASLICCLVSSSRTLPSSSRRSTAVCAASLETVSLSDVVKPLNDSPDSMSADSVLERSPSIVGLKLRKIMALSTPAAANAIAEVIAMTSLNMASETRDPRMPPAMRPVIPGVRVIPPGWKVGSPVRGMIVVPTKAPMASPKRKKTGLMTRDPTSQSMSPAMRAIPRGTEPPSGRD